MRSYEMESSTGFRRRLAAALNDAGLLHAVGGGNWPTAAITPEDLDTDGPALPDSADFIAQLMVRHGVKQQ